MCCVFSCSEFNETVAEAQLRTRQVPPDLPSQAAIQQYLHSKNRLLILVLPYFFFATFCWLGCSDAKIACLFLSFFDVNIYSCLIAISLHSCFDFVLLCTYCLHSEMIGLNLAEIVAMTYAPFLVQVIKFKIYKIELFNLNITDCPMIFLGSPVKAFFF